MDAPVTPPDGWRIRQVPWLAPGTRVDLHGEDLRNRTTMESAVLVGPALGRGGQAGVFGIEMPDGGPPGWPVEDLVLRVSYQDDEYGRDPRRTAIYRRLAELRAPQGDEDPLEGLLGLSAVGHIPAPGYLPAADLWAQVLDRGGSTLWSWVEARRKAGTLPGPEAGVAVIAPIAAALATCHRAGIVHRDIKPGNVFVVDGAPSPPPHALAGPRARRLFQAGLPFARLGDLGSMTNLSPAALNHLLAGTAPESMAEDDDLDADGPDAMTHTFTTSIDTGPFTPPEVRTHSGQGEANPAGDVWQLAVTMHYACVGDLPFAGWRGSAWKVDRTPYLAAASRGEPTSEFFASLPERLQYLMRWCLAPDPVDRPDMAYLCEELEPIAAAAYESRAGGGGAAVAVSGTISDPFVTSTGGDSRDFTSDSGAGESAEQTVKVGPTPRTPRPGSEGGAGTAGRVTTTGGHEVSDDAGRSPRVPRLALIATVAALVVALIVGLGWRRLTRSDDAAEPMPQQDSELTPLPTQPTAPPFTGNTTWVGTGLTLRGQLPQLFTGNPLGYRPVLAGVTEGTYSFCDACSDEGLRLRVDITPRNLPAGTNLTMGSEGAQPLGPYVVLVTRPGVKVPASSLTSRGVRAYPIAAPYATENYGQVVLVPANDIGRGRGQSAGDTSWQTQLRQNGPTRLAFDIPGGVTYITVVWFTMDGVVGLNRFDPKNLRRS